MAETKAPLPTVRQQADALISDLIAKNPPAANIEEARQAASIPTFSKGTAAIGSDGNAIVPAAHAEIPEFTDGQVAVQEPTGQPSAATAPTDASPTSKEAILTAHQALVDGKAPKGAAPAATPAAPVEGTPAAAAAGAASAEAAAEAIADAFAEFDEFEFTDPDLEVPVPIRVPKKFSETVKRGYGRRAALDRAMNYAKNADPVLRGLIETGQIQQILPLLRRALSDPAYGEYVTQGYQRAQAGLPLIEQAKIEAAAQAAPPVPAPGYAPEFDPLADDPFFAERVRPLMQKIETLEQRYAREEQERAQQAQRQQQIRAQNQQRDMELRAAHQDIANAYPQHARLDMGPNDPFWGKAVKFANEAGYIDAYGPRAGVVFGAQMAMQIEAERLAATGSPTADALRAAEAQHGELARREAMAASRAVGGGSATPAPRPAPPAAPNPRNPDGTLKSAAQFLRESQAHLASVR